VTNNNDLLKEYPNKRIRAIDGMAVTADVWEDAHNYHRQAQRFHNLYSHGNGIVTGLQVIASDPPDSAVYILPGVAVDSAGHLIVIAEPTAYDIGRQVDGPLHLVLTYGESRPRSEGQQSTQEGAPLFVQSEFGAQALPELPNTPYIELARVRRQGKSAAIVDAKDAAHPAANEIDLRWRQTSVATVRETVGVAVVYAGMAERRHGEGLLNLARAVNHHTHYNVIVDDNALLTGGLADYALVCVVAQRAFQFSPDEQSALQAYVQGGGTVFLESCRREATTAPSSDQSFQDLISAFGVKMADVVKAGHALLKQPNFFVSLPAGYEVQGTLLAGGGVVLSTADYACLWQGEQRNGAASREAIRSALELGENLICYAAERRNAARK
jgi:hypothetical protein